MNNSDRTDRRPFRNRSLSASSLLVALLLLMTLAPAAPASVYDGSSIVLDNATSSYQLGMHMDYIEDPSRKLSLNEITSAPYRERFSLHRKNAPSFGFTESAFWYRTEIVNPYPTAQTLILEETIPYIDSIRLYTPDRSKPGGYAVRHAGDKLPFKDREILHHNFLFKITVGANQRLPVFIRIESRAAVMTPFTIWQEAAFDQHARNINILYGLFFGILISIAIYSLFLLLNMRETIYLYFILFIGCVALVVSTSHGLSYMYLWPESPRIAEMMQVVGISLFQIIGILFARSFLHTRETLPHINRLFNILLLVHTLIIGTALVSDDFILIAKISILCLYLYSFLLLLSGILALRSGNRAARFYLLAWTSSIIGALITALTLFNILPYHFVLLNAGYLFGFLLDVIFLSLALSDKILVLRQERDQAQQSAHETLQSSKERLEVEVAERTKDLVSARKEAELANQAKTQFLSNMSHELRSPLIGILGFSELLLTDEEHPLTPEQQENTQVIHDSGNHLKELIDDVLNIAIIESGSFAIDLQSISLREALAEAITLVQASASKQKIEIIDRTTDESEMFWVAADRLRLRQVIINLLSNAIKYSNSPGRVTVALEQTESGVRLCVRDRGPGISKENLATIFEPFTRHTDNAGIEGVGIGLTITRKLIKLMNGWITVDSVLGEGSTFSIELPASLNQTGAATAAKPHPAASPRSMALAARNAKQHRILYIEDNLSSQVFLEHVFKRRKDVTLHFSSTGLEGIASAREHTPDIVLTDIRLPDITGFDVLRELKEHKKTAHIPVIAISANATPDDLEKGRDIGFVNYLTKPVEINILMDTVNRLLLQEG